jgi:hypothetical protein
MNASRWERPGRRTPTTRSVFRPSAHAVRRERLARDVLHDRRGALADERDGHRVGAHAVACDAAGGVGGPQEGGNELIGSDPALGALERPRSVGAVTRDDFYD